MNQATQNDFNFSEPPAIYKASIHFLSETSLSTYDRLQETLTLTFCPKPAKCCTFQFNFDSKKVNKENDILDKELMACENYAVQGTDPVLRIKTSNLQIFWLNEITSFYIYAKNGELDGYYKCTFPYPFLSGATQETKCTTHGNIVYDSVIKQISLLSKEATTNTIEGKDRLLA